MSVKKFKKATQLDLYRKKNKKGLNPNRPHSAKPKLPQCISAQTQRPSLLCLHIIGRYWQKQVFFGPVISGNLFVKVTQRRLISRYVPTITSWPRCTARRITVHNSKYGFFFSFARISTNLHFVKLYLRYCHFVRMA